MPRTSSKKTPTTAAKKSVTAKAIAKVALKPPVSYIVGATGDDFFCSGDDLALARKQRDKDYIWKYPAGNTVVVNGYAANDDEGGDRHMQKQLMHYLASKPIKPIDGPRCTAFAHTSDLELKVQLGVDYVTDGSLGPFAGKPTATVFKFDEKKVLDMVLARERKSEGFFAPFAQAHVQKTLHIAHNTYATREVENADGTRRKYFSVYLVKLRILTGFGIMTARGELKLSGPFEADKLKYPAHINWHSWGFTAEDCWKGGFALSCVGHPKGF